MNENDDMTANIALLAGADRALGKAIVEAFINVGVSI